MGLQMLVRLADRKGNLKGDLSPLQERALIWMLGEDFSLQTELEKERMKYTLLAGNPQLYTQLYEEDDIDPNVPKDEDVQWMKPDSLEDVDGILEMLNSPQVKKEMGI